MSYNKVKLTTNYNNKIKYKLNISKQTEIISILSLSFIENIDNIRYIIPPIPVIFHSLSNSINSYKEIKQKHKYLGYINSPNNNNLEITDFSIFNYKYIVFYGDNTIKDYWNIIYLFLNGCYVLYYGDRNIFLDIYNKFSDFIIYITNWSDSEIKNIIHQNKNKQINTRNLVDCAYNYHFMNIINNYYNHKSTLTNYFSKIFSKSDKWLLEKYKLDIINKKSTLIETINYIKTLNNLNNIYIQNKQELVPYYIWIATTIHNSKYYNGDILLLSINNLNISKYMTKTIFNSHNWEFIKTTKPIEDYDIIIFKNIEIVKSYKKHKNDLVCITIL